MISTRAKLIGHTKQARRLRANLCVNIFAYLLIERSPSKNTALLSTCNEYERGAMSKEILTCKAVLIG